MSIQVLEKIYHGSQLSTVTANVIYFRLPCDCDISEIRLIGAGFNSGLGNWLFNVSVDGANVFSGGSRITFNSGANDVTKTGLSVSGSQGDIVILNLEQSAAGVLQSPITLLMTIDDGLSSGGGTAYLPDIAPSSPNAFDDEFDGVTLDAKWSKYGSADLVETFANGSLKMGCLSNANGFAGIYQALPSGAWDWVTKVLFPVNAIASGQIDFSLAIFDNAASSAAALIVAPLLEDSGSNFNLPGVYLFTDRTTFSGTTINTVFHGNARASEDAAKYTAVYMRIKRNGNAYNFYLSLNGVGWFEVGSIADITSHFAPSHIGLLARNTSGSTRNIAFVDWTRLYVPLPDFMGG